MTTENTIEPHPNNTSFTKLYADEPLLPVTIENSLQAGQLNLTTKCQFHACNKSTSRRATIMSGRGRTALTIATMMKT